MSYILIFFTLPAWFWILFQGHFPISDFSSGLLVVAVSSAPNGPCAASHETHTDTSTNECTSQNVNTQSFSRSITLFGWGEWKVEQWTNSTVG